MARRGPSHKTLILLIATSITLITFSFRGNGATDAVRDDVGGALAPIGDAVDWLVSPIQNAWQGAFGYDELQAENERLKAELAAVGPDALAIAALERDRDEMAEMLRLEQTIELPTIAARISTASSTNFKPTWSIDRGTDDGVKLNMPVVVGEGLVGRISRVTSRTAELQLIIDPEFAVGVRLSRSGEAGIAAGKGRGELMEVDFVSADVAVVPGETISTSGLDGSNYPRGLVVGTAVDATVDVNLGTQTIELAPAIDLDQVSLVAVILWEPIIRTDSPSEAR